MILLCQHRLDWTSTGAKGNPKLVILDIKYDIMLAPTFCSLIDSALDTVHQGLLLCRAKGPFNFLQGPTFCFHHITCNVHDSEKADTCKSQINFADTELINKTQKVETNYEVWHLVRERKNATSQDDWVAHYF